MNEVADARFDAESSRSLNVLETPQYGLWRSLHWSGADIVTGPHLSLSKDKGPRFRKARLALRFRSG